MKLSIVINHTQPNNHISKVFENILEYTNLDLEIILFDVVDNNNDVSEIFSKYYLDAKKNNLKIIYAPNYTPIQVFNSSLEYITGDYLLFLDSNFKSGKFFIDKVLNVMGVIKADIFEFLFRFESNTIKYNFEFHQEINLNTIYHPKKDMSIFGLTSLLFYPKLYKVSFLKENIDLIKNAKELDSILFIKLLFFADTYYFADFSELKIIGNFSGISITKHIENWRNYINFLKTLENWKIIDKYMEFNIIKFNNMFLTLAFAKNNSEGDIVFEWKQFLEEIILPNFPKFIDNVMLLHDKKLMKDPLLKKYLKLNKKKNI